MKQFLLVENLLAGYHSSGVNLFVYVADNRNEVVRHWEKSKDLSPEETNIQEHNSNIRELDSGVLCKFVAPRILL